MATKREAPRVKIRLKKDDTVVVRSGKYKGQSGKVLATHPADNTVTVENVNVVKKHAKPSRGNPQGGIVDVTKPIHVSKVGIQDPTSKKPTRIGYQLDAKGNKARIYKSSGKEIKS
jgi:large subunit ribosomal protein L24